MGGIALSGQRLIMGSGKGRIIFVLYYRERYTRSATTRRISGVFESGWWEDGDCVGSSSGAVVYPGRTDTEEERLNLSTCRIQCIACRTDPSFPPSARYPGLIVLPSGRGARKHTFPLLVSSIFLPTTYQFWLPKLLLLLTITP